METFKDYAYYYNAFYKDKNYKQEAEQVKLLLNRCDCNMKKIINFGCGTGRHDIELAKLGYQCSGIDVSSLMIDIAKKNAKNADVDVSFSVADVRSYESQEKYDAVISLFHVMSYQNKNDDILSAFRSARNVLEKGYFLFDVWYGPGVVSDKPCVRVKEVDDEDNRLIRIARPIMYDKENLVDVNYEVLVIDKESGKVRIIKEIHKMRYFFRMELEYFLKEAGFELIDNIDCRTFGETSFNTWTSYFIARTI